jgi:hypothetical protein
VLALHVFAAFCEFADLDLLVVVHEFDSGLDEGVYLCL